MAKIEEKPWDFEDNLREQEVDDHRVWLELRAELAAVPAEAVRRPLGNVAPLVAAALAVAEEARALGRASEVQLARVERLATALRDDRDDRGGTR